MIRKQLPIGNKQLARAANSRQSRIIKTLPIAHCPLPIEIKNPPRNERVHHYEQS
jgi:hypothetical protein